jgi:hypothetical protein
MNRFGVLTMGNTRGLLALEPVGREDDMLAANTRGAIGP